MMKAGLHNKAKVCPLSIDERLIVYRGCLEDLKATEKDFSQFFICLAINSNIHLLESILEKNNLSMIRVQTTDAVFFTKYFPEFAKYKPDNIDWKMPWFYSKDSRKTALMEIIKELEDEKAKEENRKDEPENPDSPASK